MNFHVPLNLLVDFHQEQERFRHRRSDDDSTVIERRSRLHRESPPDPLGMALNRLQLGEKLRASALQISRLIQLKTHRKA